MAPLPDYVTGTITLTNGSPNFTGDGTGWLAAGFREGDTILGIEDNEGVVYVIESITDNDAGTLTQDWQGATGTYAYRMRYLSDGQRVTAQARQLIELLGNGNLQAVAGLPGTPQTLMMFTGPGAMVEVPRTDLISGVAYDVQVDTLADRDAYDSADAGFAVLVSDIGDGRAAIYSKLSNATADWSDPAYVTGPVGPIAEVTVGTTTTGAPGTPASVTGTPTVDGIELDFTIPAGEGFSAEGDYSGSTAYVKGDVVQYQGSSWIALQATTGNAPPTFPTTSNAYWQLLARAGNDGAGTVTAIMGGDGVSVDNTDPTEPVVSLDIMGESVKTANYTLVAADYGGTFIADDTDPIEFAFEAAATLGAKWWAVVKNTGAGDLTLKPDGSETIDGDSEIVLKQGQSCLVTCNGTDLRTLFLGGAVGDDFSLPTGTTAGRPDPATNGMMRYNEDYNVIEAYVDGEWSAVQTGDFPYEIEYLVVGGGGAGSRGTSGTAYGGGGAGAVPVTGSRMVRPGEGVPVVIGAGGAPNGTNGTPGGAGTQSSIGAIIASGGGGGGELGQGGSNGTFSGGAASGSTSGGGAGGGGNGASATPSAGGSGGTGAPSSISGASVQYGGGGGGTFTTGGAGGAGGGGAGGGNGSGVAGGANTGGGGGGAGAGGGAGGSGIVIIRYLGGPRGTGGTITSTGGYTIHTFTGSGTFTG